MSRTKKTRGFLIALLLSVAVAFTIAFSFSGCEYDNSGNSNGQAETPENPDESETQGDKWKTNYNLPDSDGVKVKLLEIYGSEEKMFWLQQNRVMRMACPQNDAYISLDFMFEPIAYAKTVFEDCVAEFNEVFSVINPHYKFRINYAPSEEDFKSEHSVRVSTVTAFSKPNTLGTAAHNYSGDYIRNGWIRLREDVPDDGSKILSVFKHELMHLLGAGDAYNNPEATKDTIMQGYAVSGPFSFSVSDVAFLDALYRNPDIGYSDKYIKNYIQSYAANNIYTYSKNEKIIYKTAVSGVKDIAEQVRNAGYVSEQTEDVIAALSDGWAFDGDFGKQNVRFTELTPVAENENTVYYSGSFDVDENKYWHGTRKFGSNTSSSMGIKYTDYGSGILFAMPNGTANATFFVKSGDYVFAFHRAGSFVSLSALKPELLRIYKVE